MGFSVQASAHHGITVSDLRRSQRFFVDVLGFEPRGEVDLDTTFSSGITGIPGAKIRVALLAGPGVDVELLEYAPTADVDAVVQRRSSDVGAVHLALYVDDVDAAVREAAKHGWRLAGAIQTITVGPRVGGRAAYLIDSDGLTLEFVQRPNSTEGN